MLAIHDSWLAMTWCIIGMIDDQWLYEVPRNDRVCNWNDRWLKTVRSTLIMIMVLLEGLIT